VTEFHESKHLPDLVSEFYKFVFVLRIKAVRFCWIYEDARIESTSSEHDGGLHPRILVENVFCSNNES
jgi:hypothetical protein